MKNKKIIIAIVSALVLLMLIGIPLAFKSSNKVSFQSKEEMTEVINGTWRTGDTEFDFVLTIGGGIVNFSMDGKEDEESDNLICVPEMGYISILKVMEIIRVTDIMLLRIKGSI